MLSWRPCTSRWGIEPKRTIKHDFWLNWVHFYLCSSMSTPQYGGEAGKLAILAFPCNQFGAQEPGSQIIIMLCESNEMCVIYCFVLECDLKVIVYRQ